MELGELFFVDKYKNAFPLSFDGVEIIFIYLYVDEAELDKEIL